MIWQIERQQIHAVEKFCFCNRSLSASLWFADALQKAASCRFFPSPRAVFRSGPGPPCTLWPRSLVHLSQVMLGGLLLLLTPGPQLQSSLSSPPWGHYLLWLGFSHFSGWVQACFRVLLRWWAPPAFSLTSLGHTKEVSWQRSLRFWSTKAWSFRLTEILTCGNQIRVGVSLSSLSQTLSPYGCACYSDSRRTMATETSSHLSHGLAHPLPHIGSPVGCKPTFWAGLWIWWIFLQRSAKAVWTVDG